MLNSMTAFARHAFTVADASASAATQDSTPQFRPPLQQHTQQQHTQQQDPQQPKAPAYDERDAAATLTWELRTVNHRFLDMAFRLPEPCRDLDAPLREFARARLARGRFEATLRLQEREARFASRIDQDALVALLRAMHALQRDQPQLATPTVLDVLRWPGVLEERRPDQVALARAAEAGFHVALDALVAARANEGVALEQALSDRLAQITDNVATVRDEARQVPNTLHARILARLEGLQASVEPQRLAQEVALLAQRADVAEELDRLDAHVAAFRQALLRNEPVGRQLDFLAQELHREANTLASKACSAAMAQRGIELKVLIEQIREQVQNVE